MFYKVTCQRLALVVRRVSLQKQLPIQISKLHFPSIQYVCDRKNYSHSLSGKSREPSELKVLNESPIWIEQLNKSEIDFKILAALCESILNKEQDVKTAKTDKFWQTVCAKYLHREKKVEQAIQMFSYLQTLNPDDIQHAVYAILMGSFRGTGKQYERVIFEIWEKLKEFSDIFPFHLQPYIAQGLCETTKWKESLDLLETQGELNTIRVDLWQPILIRAVKEGDAEIVSFLLNGLNMNLNLGLRFELNAIIQELFELVQDDHVEFTMEDFCDILEILRHLPEKSIADDIMKYFNEEIPQWKCVSTTVRKHCCSCKHILPVVKFNEAEMQGLKDEILNNLILKSDVYVNTNPKELKEFLTMVETEGPFDVVIDGCNVGIGKLRGKSILVAVDHFKKMRKNKILIIGRDHMQKWRHMNEVQQDAIFFPVNNVSKDDPFILYAACQSPDTYFVSADLYTNHLHSDIDRKYFPFLVKWVFHQQIKEFRFENERCFALFPPKTDMVPSYNSQMYHIPYLHEDKIFWLCAKKNL